MKLFRRGLLLPLVLLLGALVAACVTSGPQKALNDVADALNKNDGAAFLAQIDMTPLAKGNPQHTNLVDVVKI